MRSLLDAILRAQAAIIFAITLLSLVAATGLNRLQLDFSLQQLLPADAPALAEYRAMVDVFGTDRRTSVVLNDERLWTPEGLGRLWSLHQALEALPEVERVDSLYSAQTLTVDQGELVARPLLAEQPLRQDAVDLARARINEQPLVRGRLLGRESEAAALILTLREPDAESAVAGQSQASVEAVLEAARQPGIELFQFGAQRSQQALRDALLQDLRRLAPVAGAVLLLVIGLGLRCGMAAILPLVGAGLTVLWTLGAMGWAGVPLNLLGVMLAALILVVGSSESVHLVAAYLRALPEQQAGARVPAVRRMLRQVGLPVVLTVLTTAVGLGVNGLSELPLLRDFAVIATLAILLNGLLTILLAPLLLAAAGPRQAPRGLGAEGRLPLGAAFERLFLRLNAGRPLWLLAMLGAVCLFLLPSVSRLSAGADPLSLLAENDPLHGAARQMERDFGGSRSFTVTLDGQVEQAFATPAALRTLAAVQQALNTDGVFASSVSFADQLAAVHRSLRGAYGALGEHGLPDTRALMAQSLLFLRPADLRPYLSQDGRQARILVRHSMADPSALAQRLAAFEERALHLAGEDFTVSIGGAEALLQGAVAELTGQQLTATGVLLALLFLLLAGLGTSLRGGLCALLPALVPVLLVFGLLGMAGVSLNPATALVALLAVGLSLDGALHLLHRYIELAHRAEEPELAVGAALREEGTPLVIAGVGLALGFGTFAVSGLTLVAEFGALMAATMLLALLANLVMLPLLMARLRLIGLHQIVALNIDPAVLAEAPLLADMTPYQRRKAVLISKWREFGVGEILMKQGATERNMFLILDGRAEVVRHNEGESRRVAEIGPGDLVGEVAFIRAAERIADVRALTPVIALCYDHECLQRDLRHFPGLVARLNLNICRVLGLRLADSLQRGPVS